jgi:hypothetical protein
MLQHLFSMAKSGLTGLWNKYAKPGLHSLMSWGMKHFLPVAHEEVERLANPPAPRLPTYPSHYNQVNPNEMFRQYNVTTGEYIPNTGSFKRKGFYDRRD